MKTIGVLGGLGPQATMDFEARVHAVSQALIPQHFNSGYPPMVVYYHRYPPFVVDERGVHIQPVRPDPRLTEAMGKLGEMVDFIVITSNAPHLFQGGSTPPPEAALTRTSPPACSNTRVCSAPVLAESLGRDRALRAGI